MEFMTTMSLYHDHADTYADWSSINPVNCLYDRPTILRMAGALDSRRVLELGCASGVLTGHLVERGADVLAVDAQPHMIELARRRLAGHPRASFAIADLEDPGHLAAEASIDVVVASLVLHYVKDWTPLLDELHRCLVPGGALVFSLHHPITGWLLSDQTDYHHTELVSEVWDWGGISVTAESYRRPISAVFSALRQAGLAIDAVEEPVIDLDLQDPELARTLRTQPFFLYVRATKTHRN